MELTLSEMNLEESLKKLFSLHQFGIKLGLDNIKQLLKSIGNPEKSLKAFHIAGSNGKGSTASFIASILMESGYHVGLYTSPHLVKFNERIRINGKMIPDSFVLQFMNELDEYIDQNSPTFFELTTAMAFQYFANEKVDYAVIETGLGGRLDATNVLFPLSSVITSISQEHTNILGTDPKIIAAEKGGIIKKDSNIIIGIIEEGPKQILINKSLELNSKYFLLEEYIEQLDASLLFSFADQKIMITDLPLKGEYQLTNAALAALTLLVVKPIILTSHILKGLKNVIPNSGIQARYEVVHREPKIIFDAAHNADGVMQFLREFDKESDKYEEVIVIYGTMKDKDYTLILNLLNKTFDKIFITEIDYERAATIQEVVKAASLENITAIPLKNAGEYINEFKKGNKLKCLVVLGSIYILGEIKRKLENNLLDIQKE